MGRKASWPPRVHSRGGYSRVYWKGQWHHLGPEGSEEASRRYEQLIKSWAGEREARESRREQAAGNPTVADVVRQYLSLQEQTRAGKRELENVRYALQVLVRLHGQLPAKHFKSGQLEQVQVAMATGSWMNEAERQRRQKSRQEIGWCRNRVNLMLGRVRHCFRWAERRQLVPDGTWGALRALPGLAKGNTLARETEDRRPCTEADVERVAALCPDPVGAMLRLQYHTGMRSGEVRIMRTADVDTSGDVWVYRPTHHKNAHRNQKREVAIGPIAQKILRPWLKPDDPEAFLFQPVGHRAIRPFYERTSYSESVRRAARKLGLDLHPYQSRHSYKRRVTRALGKDAAKHALGHLSEQSADHYDKGVDLDVAKEAARKVG